MEDLWVNLAYEQFSGSVKERAACYVIHRLDEEQKRKGIVTASNGCFAKGLCHQGYIQKCSVVVFVPLGTATSTVDFCRKLNGTIIIEGKNFEETKEKAVSYSNANGILYVDTHDHPDLIAALGTVVTEILEEVYEPDVIIVPAGGGGLLAGTAVASKHLSPKTKIYVSATESLIQLHG
ncbi:L-threonine dehydratase biosynthetic IlvA-like [Venturia canescens]|uniref:L-threonine dehydratase biosynthetic IlvA-like n=1 Tax=Venturia canescens TaxID=32260 RepID=UPI001C9D20E4|nr:L-threonine dehydratase biosynthetic IlvA-like [Venturia canescens]